MPGRGGGWGGGELSGFVCLAWGRGWICLLLIVFPPTVWPGRCVRTCQVCWVLVHTG